MTKKLYCSPLLKVKEVKVLCSWIRKDWQFRKLLEDTVKQR